MTPSKLEYIINRLKHFTLIGNQVVVLVISYHLNPQF